MSIEKPSDKPLYKANRKGVIKRNEIREIGVFIDGTSLDRATKRLKKRINLEALVKGVSSGTPPVVAKYFTLMPHEDDARHLAYLGAVRDAGLEVIVKRLPPVGITRQVTVDIPFVSEMIAFASKAVSNKNSEKSDEKTSEESVEPTKRIITAVCPARDTDAAFSIISSLSVSNVKLQTVVVDFEKPASHDLMKATDKWIDLIDSESIWL